jgi:hypothetical protein
MIGTSYEVELQSTSPLKMDKWLNDAQPKSEAGYKKLAEKKVYTDTKGNICIPACAIKAAMKFASSEIGKKMEAKKNRQTVQSAIFFDKEMYSIGKKKPDMIVEDVVTRGVGEKVTRVKTFRPLIKEWKIKFKLISYNVTKDFIEQSLERAGFRFGLLSHRPEFGRFIIKSFKELK